MAVSDEISRIKGNIASAYSSAGAKGATLPAVQNSANLAGCIDTITGGGGGSSATKFGISLDNLLGDVDADGMYTPTEKQFSIDMSGFKTIAERDSQYLRPPAFDWFVAGRKNLIGTIDLSNFEGAASGQAGTVGGFLYAFAATSITDVILPKNINAHTYSVTMEYTFYKCNLTNVTLSATKFGSTSFQMNRTFSECTIANIHGVENITEITQNGWNSMFYSSTLPSEWHFNSLTTITDNAVNSAFGLTKGIQKIYFPALINISTKAFGQTSSQRIFYANTSITEIHFRADMQATIEAMTQYANKWGATNATIYFDL